MEVVIIGGGPAGLFAAYNLAGFCDVTIIDKGNDVTKRLCPSPKECKKKCKPCNTLCGVGGAGLFSDGKLIFHTEIGNNLNEIVGLEKNKDLIEKVKSIFKEYDVIPKVLDGEKEKRINEVKKKARVADVQFVYTEQAHVGTDHLKQLIEKIRNDLESKGVKFICKSDVTSIGPNKVKIKDKELHYDQLIIAPGRVGASWLEKMASHLKLKYKYNPVDIGVRVEVPKEVTDDITDLVRDMKFQMYINNKVHARTFCTCPGGKVTKESHEGFTLANGYSDSGDSSPNTNFAFLIQLNLTDPQGNTNEYGRDVAALANTIGKGKIILQRLGDLRQHKRSDSAKKESYMVYPTLEDVVYGDISLALPGKIVENAISGLEKLDKVIPGVANDSTLLYAPEIKFHGLKAMTNECLETNIEGIFVAGDGAGLSRGIVGAAASGLLASEGIMKKIKK